MEIDCNVFETIAKKSKFPTLKTKTPIEDGEETGYEFLFSIMNR